MSDPINHDHHGMDRDDDPTCLCGELVHDQQHHTCHASQAKEHA